MHASLIGLLLLGYSAALADDLARDVVGILRTRCVACHGPNQQMGGVRLDQHTSAQANAAKIVVMITSGLNGRVMPPSGPRLSTEQVTRVREWVQAGVPWTDAPAGAPAPVHVHWAFRPVKRPEVPAVQNNGWVRNPIDAFVLARLEREGISPAPE